MERVPAKPDFVALERRILEIKDVYVHNEPYAISGVNVARIGRSRLLCHRPFPFPHRKRHQSRRLMFRC